LFVKRVSAGRAWRKIYISPAESHHRRLVASSACRGGKGKSGSLVTANWAKSRAAYVFAVPGPIYALNARGCNALIKQGALLADSAQDILKVLGITPPKAGYGNTSADPKEMTILDALKEKALAIDKIIVMSGLPAKKVLSMLPVMEIKGLIRNLGGGVYCRCN